MFVACVRAQSCVGQGCEPARFRACNCVGMVSEDGSRQYLPDLLDDAAIEMNIKMVNCRTDCTVLYCTAPLRPL